MLGVGCSECQFDLSATERDHIIRSPTRKSANRVLLVAGAIEVVHHLILRFQAAASNPEVEYELSGHGGRRGSELRELRRTERVIGAGVGIRGQCDHYWRC